MPTFLVIDVIPWSCTYTESWTLMHHGSTGFLCSWGIVNAYMNGATFTLVSSAHACVSLSHHISRAKPKFSDKIINNFKKTKVHQTVESSSEYETLCSCICGPLMKPALGGHQKMNQCIHLRWTKSDTDCEADSWKQRVLNKNGNRTKEPSIEIDELQMQKLSHEKEVKARDKL